MSKESYLSACPRSCAFFRVSAVISFSAHLPLMWDTSHEEERNPTVINISALSPNEKNDFFYLLAGRGNVTLILSLTDLPEG